MAKPWIKLEEDTPDKIEVMRLRNILGKEAVMDYVLRFWSWVTKNSVDGNIHGVTQEDIDSIAKCPGLAEGLVKVGWLEGREGRFSIPHFDRHLSQSALAKADVNQRVRRSRALKQKSVTECNENVTQMYHQKRKEKNNKVSGNTTVDVGAGGGAAAPPPHVDMSEGFRRWLAALCGCVPQLRAFRVLPEDVVQAAQEAYGCLPDATEYVELLTAYYADRMQEDRRRVAFWRPMGAQFFCGLGDVIFKHAQRWKREVGWMAGGKVSEARGEQKSALEEYQKMLNKRYGIAEEGGEG